jgi:hypothetical protein
MASQGDDLEGRYLRAGYIPPIMQVIITVWS